MVRTSVTHSPSSLCATFLFLPRINFIYHLCGKMESIHNPERTDHERMMSEDQAEERDVTLIIKCVVKGYHACDFSLEDKR